MKTATRSRLSVLVLAVGMLACGPRWREFDSRKCGAKARFPTQPREIPWGLQLSTGVLAGVIVDTPPAAPGGDWYVLYCVYLPEGSSEASVVTAFEAETAKGLGRIVSRSEVQIAASRGTEVVVSGPGRSRRIRYVLGPGRLVAVAASPSRTWPGADEIFLNSVEIDPAWQGPTAPPVH